jgi:hypothetical protein
MVFYDRWWEPNLQGTRVKDSDLYFNNNHLCS